jgi:hypothetical protein
LYLSSYNNAFNTLIDFINETNLSVDYLAYPILFTARHALELGFKANIRYFTKYSKCNPIKNPNTHNLADLFTEFKLQVKSSIDKLKETFQFEDEEDDIKEFDEYCKSVDSLIDRFDVLDKGSFSFRYPVDKDNKRVFQPTDKVNILDIKELFDNAMILLYHTSDIFSKYTEYADQIEKNYEDEMMSIYNDEMRSMYNDEMRSAYGN